MTSLFLFRKENSNWKATASLSLSFLVWEALEMESTHGLGAYVDFEQPYGGSPWRE